MLTPLESQYDIRMPGKLLLIYICNFHVLSNLLLIYICKLLNYICKLHWKCRWRAKFVDFKELWTVTRPTVCSDATTNRRSVLDRNKQIDSGKNWPIGCSEATDYSWLCSKSGGTAVYSTHAECSPESHTDNGQSQSIWNYCKTPAGIKSDFSRGFFFLMWKSFNFFFFSLLQNLFPFFVF